MAFFFVFFGIISIYGLGLIQMNYSIIVYMNPRLINIFFPPRPRPRPTRQYQIISEFHCSPLYFDYLKQTFEGGGWFPGARISSRNLLRLVAAVALICVLAVRIILSTAITIAMSIVFVSTALALGQLDWRLRSIEFLHFFYSSVRICPFVEYSRGINNLYLLFCKHCVAARRIMFCAHFSIFFLLFLLDRRLSRVVGWFECERGGRGRSPKTLNIQNMIRDWLDNDMLIWKGKKRERNIY